MERGPDNLSDQGPSSGPQRACGFAEVAKCRSIKCKVKAAVDGVRAAGLDVHHVEVSADEKVTVFAGKPGDDVAAYTINPWDTVLENAQEQERAS